MRPHNYNIRLGNILRKDYGPLSAAIDTTVNAARAATIAATGIVNALPSWIQFIPSTAVPTPTATLSVSVRMTAATAILLRFLQDHFLVMQTAKIAPVDNHTYTSLSRDIQTD